MALTIVHGSGNIVPKHHPHVRTPRPNGAFMEFHSGEVKLSGVVKFAGTDPRAGWKVGWIQTEWVETNWGDYRGQFDRDGSIFLQRGRPPAHPRGAMRDTLVKGDIFTRPTDVTVIPAGPLPIAVALDFSDSPIDSYRLVEQNHKTHKPNYLHEVQLEFMFCTVFTAQDPAGNFHHQAHIYWNVRWQFRFHPRHFPPAVGDWHPERVAGGTGAANSRVFHGAPTDARFAGVLTSVQIENANSRAATATAEVAKATSPNRHESLRWDSWDVRKP
jgi:hypothetical protein